MSLHFFSIPALQPQAAQDEFNAFCAAHRVLQVERQFVAAGAQSFWALPTPLARECIVSCDALDRVDGMAAARRTLAGLPPAWA